MGPSVDTRSIDSGDSYSINACTMTRHEQAAVPTRYRNANGKGVQVEETRIAVIMVGLPARGKSLIAQKGRHNVLSRTLYAG